MTWRDSYELLCKNNSNKYICTYSCELIKCPHTIYGDNIEADNDISVGVAAFYT